MDTLLKKGIFLALRSPKNSFYLCRINEETHLHASSRLKITWLEKSSNNEYTLSKHDIVLGATVICEVTLQKVTRFRYRLPDRGLRFIKKEIAYILEQENNNSGCSSSGGQKREKQSNKNKTVEDKILSKNYPKDFKTEVEPSSSKSDMNLTDSPIDTNSTNVLKSKPKLTLNKDLNFDTEFEEPFEDSGSEFDPSDVSFSKKKKKISFTTRNYKTPVRNKNVMKFKSTARKLRYSDSPPFEKNIVSKPNEKPSVGSPPEIDKKTPKNKNKIKILQNVVLNTPMLKKDSEVKTGTNNIEACYYIPHNKKYSPKMKLCSSNISATSHDSEKKKNRCTSGIPETIKQKKKKSDSSDRLSINYDTSKKNGEKRIYDKHHSCYICQKKCIKLARHLETKHSDESAVAKLLTLEKNSIQRKKGFLELTRVGDFYHNMEVLSANNGQLILCRRPSSNIKQILTYDRFGPCPYCLGFMLKSYLFIHVKTCISKNIKDDENLRKSVQVASNAIVNSILFQGNVDFRKNILDRLKNDQISTICKTDQLIIGLGYLLFEKHGSTQNDLIRQSMRQLGRLLENIRANNPHLRHRNLTFFIKPEYFDTIISSVKSLCSVKTEALGKSTYEIPSLALKIGHSLRKCVGFLRGQALRAGCIQDDLKLKNFLDILELEWEIRISSNALNTLHTRKMNNAEILPLTDDLLKLNKYINNDINIFIVLLKNNPHEKSAWQRLAEATLARIILFNKRRSGEVSRMTLKQYSSTPDWSKESTQELQNSLTAMEKVLANKLKLVQIRGKRGRTVAVILAEDVVLAIDLLVSTRQSVGVASENKFVFARSHYNSLSYIRGSDVLRSLANKAELKNPVAVTSTKLRKYVATVTQIFNLKETEVDWLARHLGHDVRVHRDFYRLHESAVELTKVSRLLLAVDEGKVSEFRGKSLEEIQLTDLPDFDEQEDSDNESDKNDESIWDETQQPEETNKKEKRTQNDTFSQDTKESIWNETEQPEETSKKEKSTQNVSVPKTSRGKQEGKKKIRRVPWTKEEITPILHFFRHQIRNNTVPGKALCDECIQKSEGALSRRNWRDVKYYMKNYLTKIYRK